MSTTAQTLEAIETLRTNFLNDPHFHGNSYEANALKDTFNKHVNTCIETINPPTETTGNLSDAADAIPAAPRRTRGPGKKTLAKAA